MLDSTSASSQHSRSAFTLVELLVVIGIIALLISILLPTLSSAREGAKRLGCASNLRQLGMAMVMYTNESKQYLPSAGHLVYEGGRWRQRSEDWIWWGQNFNFAPVGVSQDEYKLENSPIATFMGGSFTEDMAKCPSDVNIHLNANNEYIYSYSTNCRIGISHPFIVAEGEQAEKMTQIINSSEKMILFEEDEVTIDDPFGYPDYVPTRPTTTNLLSVRHDSKRENDPPYGNLLELPNPKRRGNVAYADGSVRNTSRQNFHRPAVACPRWPLVKVTDFSKFGPD